MADTVLINRAPVLTLWAAVVAERMGHDRDAALTLGKCVAGLNAQAKGRRLGVFGPPKPAEDGRPPRKTGLGEDRWVEVCGRPVPAKNTEQGLRAVVGERPIDPRKVQEYLERSFRDDLARVRQAMEDLAASFTPEEIPENAYRLYERFRPSVAPGAAGWGRKGLLDLDLMKTLARKPRP